MSFVRHARSSRLLSNLPRAMLVSHRKKFIYLKTIKTASTSVESYFERFCLPDGTWVPTLFREETVGPEGIIGRRGLPLRWYQRRPRFYDHMSALAVRKRLPSDVWNGYLKFCVVRNPFDRVISAFHFFEEMDRRGFQRMRLPANASVEERFRIWVRRYLVRRGVADDRACFTIAGRSCVDVVIRFESLQEGLRDVCERLAIPFQPEKLPRMVKSADKGSRDLSAYYDDATRRVVEKRYRFELESFGYAFPYPSASDPTLSDA